MNYDQIQFCTTATLPSRRMMDEDFGPDSEPTVMVNLDAVMPAIPVPTALPAPPRIPFLAYHFETRIPDSRVPSFDDDVKASGIPSIPPTLRVGAARHLHLVDINAGRPSGPPSAPPTAPARRLARASIFKAA